MHKAYFAKHPKTYEDLLVPHTADKEAMFEIVKIIELPAIDYGNFIYGMDVDRQYLETYAHLCSNDTIKKCLLIKQQANRHGVLVIPQPEHPSLVCLAVCLK